MAGYRGKQGRKPKASTILERERARGSAPGPGKRRMPSAPEHVRANEVAWAEWKRVGRILLDAGLLQPEYTSTLAAYCVAYARWVDAEEHLKIGVIIKARFGAMMPSPYLPIANRSMEQMTKFSGELGMTPASRSRLPQGRAEPRRSRSRGVGMAPGGDGAEDPREALKVVEGGKR